MKNIGWLAAMAVLAWLVLTIAGERTKNATASGKFTSSPETGKNFYYVPMTGNKVIVDDGGNPVSIVHTDGTVEPWR